MCFAPANVYKPDKLVLATEIQEDRSTNHEGSAKYEFFRWDSLVSQLDFRHFLSEVEPGFAGMLLLAWLLKLPTQKMEKCWQIVFGL